MLQICLKNTSQKVLEMRESLRRRNPDLRVARSYCGRGGGVGAENLRSIDWKCHNRPYFFRLGKSIFLVGEIQKMVMEEIQLERNGRCQSRP